MSDEALNYGPLAGLIGSWKGERGVDVAPEDGGETERNPYWETITFEAIGDVKNAGKQTLVILRYHQEVYMQSSNEQFHDQMGYITWDSATGIISHSFIIPRGVAVVANGCASETGDEITIDLAVSDEQAIDGISQTPFMRDNAKTTSFSHLIKLNGNELSYEMITMLDIYGREFQHKDSCTLIRQP